MIPFVKIGPYEVLGILGRGGMGIVYRARSPAGEEVALKVLGKLEAEAIARFERERRLLGGLGVGDGFVPLLDAGDSPQGPWIVMPLVSGGTLREKLRRGPLGVEGTLEVGRALAGALAKAHERGIVHRDLKPENVLFHEGRPLLADLGLAKHFDRSTAGASQTVSLSVDGSSRGTAGYMPPEQMQDAKSVGPGADVFALGAILLECLAGRPAFPGRNALEVVVRVSDGKHEKLHPEDAPRWLVAAIERALATDPADRFRDGAAFEAALAEPNGLRRGVPVALLLCGLLFAGIGAVLLGARSTDAKGPPPVEPTSPRHAPDALAIAKRLKAGGRPDPGDLGVLAGSNDRSQLLAPLVPEAVIFPLAEVQSALSQHPGCRELAALEALAVLVGPASSREEHGRAFAVLRAAKPGGAAGDFLAALTLSEQFAEGGLTFDLAHDDAVDNLYHPLVKRPDLVRGAIAPLESAFRAAALDCYLEVDVFVRTNLSGMRPFFGRLVALDDMPGLPPGFAVAHAALRNAGEIHEQVRQGRTVVIDRCLDAARACEAADPVLALHGYTVAGDFMYSDAGHAAAERLGETCLARAATLDENEARAVGRCLVHLAWEETRRWIEVALALPPDERARGLEKALDAARVEVTRTRAAGLSERFASHHVLVLEIALGRDPTAERVPPFEEDPFALVLAEPATAADQDARLTALIRDHDPNDFVKTSARALRIRARNAFGQEDTDDASQLVSLSNPDRAFEIALERLAAEKLRFR